jgi:hypothetical protein
MSIHTAGRTQVIVCDCCELPCEGEVFEERHFFAGQEDQVVTRHFCSMECREDHTGVTERNRQKVEREVRSELNFLHKLICPRCKERIKQKVM